MNTLKEILLYIWQLPQNLLGLIMLLFMKPYISKEKYKGITYVVSKKMSGGISLGNYIILSKSYKDKVKDIKNFGITNGDTPEIQECLDLYILLLLVSIFIWAWMYGTIIPYTHNGYYKFYTEKRADRLGWSC